MFFQKARAITVDSPSSNVKDSQEDDYTVNSEEGFKLYENHIQTSFIQKAMLAAGSAFMGLYDPTRQGIHLFYNRLSVRDLKSESKMNCGLQ